MKTYFVTKYWETRGIFETRGTRRPDIRAKYISTPALGGLYFENNAFATREEALADVRKRAARKLKSLERRLELVRRLAEHGE